MRSSSSVDNTTIPMIRAKQLLLDLIHLVYGKRLDTLKEILPETMKEAASL